ncbi:MAG: hypothetical protein ABIK99_04235 [candidate division WOR-3 bacterium]
MPLLFHAVGNLGRKVISRGEPFPAVKKTTDMVKLHAFGKIKEFSEVFFGLFWEANDEGCPDCHFWDPK